MKRNKLYSRREPTRDVKIYYIFCEGDKREATYFHFFQRLASSINIQIIKIDDGKNHPMGLFNNACTKLLQSPENLDPKFELTEEDEVWFITDTDKWEGHIELLRSTVSEKNNWFVAQSNPSFEVWLYYHFEKEKPSERISNWKNHLNIKIKGGFDNRKHPAQIEVAILNAETNFTTTNGQPDPATTEMFILAKKILLLVKDELENFRGKE